MDAFAFIMLMITALAGTLVLVEWYDSERQHAPNGTTAVVFSHIGLALASLVLLALFLALRGTTLASAVIVLLVLTATAGISAFFRSRRGQPNRRREGDVSRGFLYFHGGAAALLIVVAIVGVLGAR